MQTTLSIDPINNSEVFDVFSHYPDDIRKRLMFMRQLIIETADELVTDGVLEESLQETLKWGDPSYLVKVGSTIRIGEKKADQIAMYFHCKTKLVETFKELYGNTFKFEGNRAIVFDEEDTIPVEALKHCIQLSLTYKKIKHLPMLGA